MFHFHASVTSRSQGRSASAHVAYISGKTLVDERTNQKWDYQNKSKEVLDSFTLAPEGCPAWVFDPQRLWNAVEAFEDQLTRRRFRGHKDPDKNDKSLAARAKRLNSCSTQYTATVALPLEITNPTHLKMLSRQILQECYVNRGLIASGAIHTKVGNPHLHIAVAPRPFDVEKQTFSEQKFRMSRTMIKELRAQVAQIGNTFSRTYGYSYIWDHRSYQDQGLDIVPSRKQGYHAGQLEREGHYSRIVEENAEIRRLNIEIFLEKPEELIRLVASQKAVFTSEDLAAEIFKRVSGDPILYTILKQKVAGVMVPHCIGKVANQNYIYEGPIPEEAMTALADSYAHSLLTHPEAKPFGYNLKDQPVYTTQSYQDLEAEVKHSLEVLQNTRKKGFPLTHQQEILSQVEAHQGFSFSSQQQSAIAFLLGEQAIRLLTGKAGTGKTTVLKPLVEVYRSKGYAIIGTSFQGKVVDQLSRELQITGYTLDQLHQRWSRLEKLHQQIKSGTLKGDALAAAQRTCRRLESDRLTPQHLVIVDEGNMIQGRLWQSLLKEVKRSGAVLRIVADNNQIKALTGGDFSRLIEKQLGSFELTEVHRQKEIWMRDASALLNDHQVYDGLKLYFDKERVHSYRTAFSTKYALIQDYLEHCRHNPDQNVMILAFRNEDVKEFNEAIRVRLKEAGVLGEEFTLRAHGSLPPAHEGPSLEQDSVPPSEPGEILALKPEKPSLRVTFPDITVAVGEKIMFTSNDHSERYVKTLNLEPVESASDPCLPSDSQVFDTPNASKLSNVQVSETASASKLSPLAPLLKSLDVFNLLPFPQALPEKPRNFGVKNGTLGVVESFDRDQKTLRVRLQDHRVVEFDTRLYGAITPAYAITVNKAEGETFDRVYGFFDRAMRANALLIWATRHREDFHAYMTFEEGESFQGLIQSVGRSDYKPLLSDYHSSGEAYHWGLVKNYQKEAQAAISMYLEIQERELRDPEKGAPKELWEDFGKHRLARDEKAETILANWSDTAPFVHQAGMRRNVLEIHAQSRQRDPTPGEILAIDKVEDYFRACVSARRVWQEISQTYPGALAKRHDLYSQYEVLRDDRNRQAYEIASLPSVYKYFFVLKKEEGVYTSWKGGSYDGRPSSFKAAQKQADQHILKYRRHYYESRLAPEAQSVYHQLLEYQSLTRECAVGIKHLLEMQKQVESETVLAKCVSLASPELIQQREMLLADLRAQRDDLAFAIVNSFEPYADHFSFLGIEEEQLLVYATLGEAREVIRHYQKATTMAERAQRAAQLVSFVQEGETGKINGRVYSLFKSLGLDLQRLKFEQGWNHTVGTGSEISIQTVADLEKAYTDLQTYKQVHREASQTWRILQAHGVAEKAEADLKLASVPLSKAESRKLRKEQKKNQGSKVFEPPVILPSEPSPTLLKSHEVSAYEISLKEMRARREELAYGLVQAFTSFAGEVSEFGVKEELLFKYAALGEVRDLVRTYEAASTVQARTRSAHQLMTLLFPQGDDKINGPVYGILKAARLNIQRVKFDQGWHLTGPKAASMKVKTLLDLNRAYKSIETYKNVSMEVGLYWKALLEKSEGGAKVKLTSDQERDLQNLSKKRDHLAYHIVKTLDHFSTPLSSLGIQEDRLLTHASLGELRHSLQAYRRSNTLEGRTHRAHQIVSQVCDARGKVAGSVYGVFQSAGIDLEQLKFEQGWHLAKIKGLELTVKTLSELQQVYQDLQDYKEVHRQFVEEWKALNVQATEKGITVQEHILQLSAVNTDTVAAVESQVVNSSMPASSHGQTQPVPAHALVSISGSAASQGTPLNQLRADKIVRATELLQDHAALIQRSSPFEYERLIKDTTPRSAYPASYKENDSGYDALTLMDHLTSEQIKQLFCDYAHKLVRNPVCKENGSELRFGTGGGFIVNVSKGLWTNNYDGDKGGNLFQFIAKVRNISVKEAIQWVGDWAKAPASAQLSPEERQKRLEEELRLREEERAQKVRLGKYKALRAWNDSVPIEGTLAEQYLQKTRGIQGPLSSDIRYGAQRYTEGQKIPALLSFGRDTQGELVCYQEIFLDPTTATKSKSVEVVKKTHGALTGAAVRIQQGEGVTYVAEGLETGLSLKEAGVQGEILVCLGQSNIKNVTPVNTIVVICGDYDAEGQANTNKAAQRSLSSLQERGYQAQIIWPETQGDKRVDFNDLLRDHGPLKIREVLRQQIPDLVQLAAEETLTQRTVPLKVSPAETRLPSPQRFLPSRPKILDYQGRESYDVNEVFNHLGPYKIEQLFGLYAHQFVRNPVSKRSGDKIRFGRSGGFVGDLRTGLWKDNYRGEGGNIFQYVASARNIPIGEAIQWVGEWSGAPSTMYIAPNIVEKQRIARVEYERQKQALDVEPAALSVTITSPFEEGTSLSPNNLSKEHSDLKKDPDLKNNKEVLQQRSPTSPGYAVKRPRILDYEGRESYDANEVFNHLGSYKIEQLFGLYAHQFVRNPVSKRSGDKIRFGRSGGFVGDLRTGLWKDNYGGEGGNIFQYVASARNISIGEAIRWVGEWSGAPSTMYIAPNIAEKQRIARAEYEAQKERQGFKKGVDSDPIVIASTIEEKHPSKIQSPATQNLVDVPIPDVMKSNFIEKREMVSTADALKSPAIEPVTSSFENPPKERSDLKDDSDLKNNKEVSQQRSPTSPGHTVKRPRILDYEGRESYDANEVFNHLGSYKIEQLFDLYAHQFVRNPVSKRSGDKIRFGRSGGFVGDLRTGLWKDNYGGEGGNIFQYVASAHNISIGEAIRWVGEWSGAPSTMYIAPSIAEKQRIAKAEYEAQKEQQSFKKGVDSDLAVIASTIEEKHPSKVQSSAAQDLVDVPITDVMKSNSIEKREMVSTADVLKSPAIEPVTSSPENLSKERSNLKKNPDLKNNKEVLQRRSPTSPGYAVKRPRILDYEGRESYDANEVFNHLGSYKIEQLFGLYAHQFVRNPVSKRSGDKIRFGRSGGFVGDLRTGLWKNNYDGEGGNIFQYVASARNISIGEAIRWVGEWSGAPSTMYIAPNIAEKQRVARAEYEAQRERQGFKKDVDSELVVIGSALAPGEQATTSVVSVPAVQEDMSSKAQAPVKQAPVESSAPHATKWDRVKRAIASVINTPTVEQKTLSISHSTSQKGETEKSSFAPVSHPLTPEQQEVLKVWSEVRGGEHVDFNDLLRNHGISKVRDVLEDVLDDVVQFNEEVVPVKAAPTVDERAAQAQAAELGHQDKIKPQTLAEADKPKPVFHSPSLDYIRNTRLKDPWVMLRKPELPKMHFEEAASQTRYQNLATWYQEENPVTEVEAQAIAQRIAFENKRFLYHATSFIADREMSDPHTIVDYALGLARIEGKFFQEHVLENGRAPSYDAMYYFAAYQIHENQRKEMHYLSPELQKRGLTEHQADAVALHCQKYEDETGNFPGDEQIERASKAVNFLETQGVSPCFRHHRSEYQDLVSRLSIVMEGKEAMPLKAWYGLREKSAQELAQRIDKVETLQAEIGRERDREYERDKGLEFGL